jgi:hypothetical protein
MGVGVRSRPSRPLGSLASGQGRHPFQAAARRLRPRRAVAGPAPPAGLPAARLRSGSTPQGASAQAPGGCTPQGCHLGAGPRRLHPSGVCPRRRTRRAAPLRGVSSAEDPEGCTPQGCAQREGSGGAHPWRRSAGGGSRLAAGRGEESLSQRSSDWHRSRKSGSSCPRTRPSQSPEQAPDRPGLVVPAPEAVAKGLAAAETALTPGRLRPPRFALPAPRASRLLRQPRTPEARGGADLAAGRGSPGCPLSSRPRFQEAARITNAAGRGSPGCPLSRL